MAKYALSVQKAAISGRGSSSSALASGVSTQVTQQTYAQRLASSLGISEAEAVQRLNQLGVSTAKATAVIPDSGGDVDLSPKSSLSAALKELNKAIMGGASKEEISALANAYSHGEKVQYAPTVVQKYTQPDGTFNLVQAVKDNVSRDYLINDVGMDANVVDAVALMNSKGLMDAQGQYSPPQAIAAGVPYETLASLGLTKHEYNDWQQKITAGEYAGYGAGLEYAQRTLSKDYIPTIEEFELAHPEIKTAGERIAAYKAQYGNFSYSSHLVKYPGGRSNWEYEKVPTQLSRSWTTEFTPPKELTAVPEQLTIGHSVTQIPPAIPQTYHIAPVSSEAFTKQFVQAAKDKGLEPEGKKEKAAWKELMTGEASKEYAARYGKSAVALGVTTQAVGTVFPVVKGLYYPESKGITLGQIELTGVNLALLGGGTEALSGITKGLSAAGRSVTKLGGKLFGVKPAAVATPASESLNTLIANVEKAGVEVAQGEKVLSGLKAGTPSYAMTKANLRAAQGKLEVASTKLEQALTKSPLTAPEGAQPAMIYTAGQWRQLPYRAPATEWELGGTYHPYNPATKKFELPRFGVTYRASPGSLWFMKSPKGKITTHYTPSKLTWQRNVMPTTRELARLQGITDIYGEANLPALRRFGITYGETQPYRAVGIEAPYYSEVWLYPRVAPPPLESIKLPKAYPALERIPQATYGEFTPERFGAGKPVYTVAEAEAGGGELWNPFHIPTSRVRVPPVVDISPASARVKPEQYTEPQLYYQWEKLGDYVYLRPTYNPRAIIVPAGTEGGVSQRRLVAPALTPSPIAVPELSSAAATAPATSTSTSTETATETQTETQPATKPATKTTTTTTDIPTSIEPTPIPPDFTGPGDEFFRPPILFPKPGGAGGETGSRGYTKHGKHSAYIKMFGEIPELRVYLPAIFGEKRAPRISSSLWAKLQHHPEIETLEETGIESTPFGKKRVFTVAEKFKVTTGAKGVKEISRIPTKKGFVNLTGINIPDRYYLGHKLPEGSVSEVI